MSVGKRHKNYLRSQRFQKRCRPLGHRKLCETENSKAKDFKERLNVLIRILWDAQPQMPSAGSSRTLAAQTRDSFFAADHL